MKTTAEMSAEQKINIPISLNPRNFLDKDGIFELTVNGDLMGIVNKFSQKG